jgi:hypothetical protein
MEWRGRSIWIVLRNCLFMGIRELSGGHFGHYGAPRYGGRLREVQVGEDFVLQTMPIRSSHPHFDGMTMEGGPLKEHIRRIATLNPARMALHMEPWYQLRPLTLAFSSVLAVGPLGLWSKECLHLEDKLQC